MSKTRVKVPAVPAPQDLQEAADFLSRIGQAEREMRTLTDAMNEEIEKQKKLYLGKVEEWRQRLEQLVAGLYAYAASHRTELTEGEKKKTVSLPTGVFGWRMTPKAVAIKGVKEVLERLKNLNLLHFIRTKKDIDKEAMLKDEVAAIAVEGVTISQREEFFAKPAETTAEVSVTHGRQMLKVALAAGPTKKAPQKKSA